MSRFKPEIVDPVDNEEKWAILDYNAVVRHAQGMGNDPDAVYGSATGRAINSAEHTVQAFIDAYFIPILDAGFTPRQILVAHDDGHVYRSKILPTYKKKRDERKADESKTDPELFEELDKANNSIKRFLAYMGCTQAKVGGVEGDDIIAYFNQLPGKKQIFTVDADILRLADENTMIVMKNKPVLLQSMDADNLPKNMIPFYSPFLDEDGEFPTWNIFKLLTLFKSLVGDSSDEYKGVPMFGEKMWADAVGAFGREGLEELVELIKAKDWPSLEATVNYYAENEPASITHKILARLHEHRSAWRTCWMVADLHPELCWKPTNKKLTNIEWFKRVPNKERVISILERNYALDHLDDLEPFFPVEWLIDGDNFEEGDIEEFGQLCAESPHISYDYEGFAEECENFKDFRDGFVDVFGQEITGVSFNFGNNLQYTCYITVNHKDSANLPVGIIRRFFEAIPAEKVKVAHNSTFEEVLTATNLDGYSLPVGSVHDTSIMSVYEDENKDLHQLKALSLTYLGYKQATYKETLAAADAKNMKELTSSQVLKYGLDDSTCTGHLYDLMKLIMQLENTWEFYRDHEPYVNHRLAMSFIKGVDVDFERLDEIAREDREEINEGMAELRDILEERCSKVNREAAQTFFNEEKKWLEKSSRKKYGAYAPEKMLNKADAVAEEIEKMDIADETLLEIAQRIRLKIPAARGKKAKAERDLSGVEHTSLIAWVVRYDMHKKLLKLIEGSVYVPYKSELISPAFAPSALNLDKVAEAVGLPKPGTAAKGKLGAWETGIRELDFENEVDKFDEFNDQQKEFILLLREAKDHFNPDKRGHENYLKFQTFCCNTLGIESKEVFSGTELNLGSSNQMQELLYCMLELPVRLRGKASDSRRDLGFWEGAPSVDALARDTALSEDISGHDDLKWKEDVINLIKKVTECQTRFSLYHNPYPKFQHPKDGKIHPGIRNCGTVTKRPSGSSPNILQVSKHQKKGAMRGVFVPPRGYAVVPIDFAGQELRIQASETKDPNLLSVYLGKELADKYIAGEVVHITYDMVKDLTDLRDLHGLTASGITEHFGLDASGKLVAGGQPEVKWVPPSYEEYMEAYGNKEHEYHDLASKVRKRPAKSTNFLLSYGGTGTTLSHRLIIPEAVANGIMDSTLTLYSGIVTTQDATADFAKQHGYVLTAYGTRRHANDDIFSKTKGPFNRQKRQLYNARIQGCAADILKVVLANCEKTDIWDRYDAIMVAPVYDEVVAFVPFEHCWDFVQDLRAIMNITPPGHAVPMVADVSIGPNWQIQHELGDQPTREAFEKCLREDVIPAANAIWDRIEAA